MLYLSPRNSDEAQYAVMNEAQCHKWLCAKEMRVRVEGLMQGRPKPNGNADAERKGVEEDLVIDVPDQGELLKDEPTPVLRYEKKLEEARWDPLVMLHTSRFVAPFSFDGPTLRLAVPFR